MPDREFTYERIVLLIPSEIAGSSSSCSRTPVHRPSPYLQRNESQICAFKA